MDLGRAIGFIAGGAAEGYGKGVVDQARLNWEKMLKDESETRADARTAKQQDFEVKQTDQKQTFEAGQNQLTRDQHAQEHTDDINQRSKEFDVRTAETKAQQEENKNYRNATLADQRKYRQDQYNIRLREVEGKEAQITTADMKKIEDAEKSLLGEFPTDDDREKAAPKIVSALQQSGDQKLARYYGALHGMTPPAATSAPLTSDTAAPGFGNSSKMPAALPDIGPSTSTPTPASAGQPSLSGDETSTALQKARDAIAKGAPRDAVVSRLRASGIDPSGL